MKHKKTVWKLKRSGNKKSSVVILISLLVVVSFSAVWMGHFLFGWKVNIAQWPIWGGAAGKGALEDSAGQRSDSVRYFHKSETIHGLKQEIHLLEVDPKAKDITIRPVLSHDLIYGFEKLTDMTGAIDAAGAVNSGFFTRYGLPSGMVITDGELLSKATGKYPVFTMKDGKAEFMEFSSSLELEITRRAAAVCTKWTTKLPADCLNTTAGSRQTAVYTSAYGHDNRAERQNITATIVDGIVKQVAGYPGETEIPADGMLVTFYDTKKYNLAVLPLRVGDAVKLVHQPSLDGIQNAYECGCWLVKDGVSVVPQKDPWIGVLTNRDPRTAIGIREDGTVVLLVVDGRQPGYSEGFTGQELSEYLIGLGVKDAAMLDGGASSEMLVAGKLVSKPSYKGEERTLGGGLLVLQK